ncbi:hypothetical protein H5410_015544 [Solanum commersonii]|uniref:Uncharacterized protein n=1 Tax=Solanum commersonii TaxID=4109 RepID=A0A9J5ZU54_SOLCO|nr:hypothetical protein H5410_015544 [Solanum commersonii]
MSDSESDSNVEEGDLLALEGTDRHLVRGRKIKDAVVEKKGQEAREYTMREHLRVAKLIRHPQTRERKLGGGNVPPTPTVPRGQTHQFRLKKVVKEGKTWWQNHTRVRYFSDVCIERDSLARDFPRILMRIQELHMEFVFVELA